MAEAEPIAVQQARPNKSRNLVIGACALLVVAGVVGIWLFNYVSANRPLQRVLTTYPRNQVVSARAHFGNWVDMDTLVFDLTSISGSATRMDVFRAFLQYAEAMKDRHFTKVILSARGTGKFTLDGDYFQELGKEFGGQNPMYTIRTFPIHLAAMDGSKRSPNTKVGFSACCKRKWNNSPNSAISGTSGISPPADCQSRAAPQNRRQVSIRANRYVTPIRIADGSRIGMTPASRPTRLTGQRPSFFPWSPAMRTEWISASCIMRS